MCSACSGIFGVFYTIFGALLKLCCSISGGYYLLALLFFTIIMEIVLFPLGIKQQKSSVKQAKLRPKEMLIREKYKGRNDRATQQKVQMEINELYQKEGYNVYSGCLPLLIQLPIILILYGVIRMPVTYTAAGNIDLASQYKVAVQIIDGAVGAIDESRLIASGAEVKPAASEASANAENSSEAVSGTESKAVESSKAKEETSVVLSQEQQDLKTLRSNYVKTLQSFAGEDNVTNDRYNSGEVKNNTNLEFALVDFILNDYKTQIKDRLQELFVPELTNRYIAEGMSRTDAAAKAETNAKEIISKNIKDTYVFNDELRDALPNFAYLGGSETLLDTPSQKGFSTLLIIPLLVFITSVASFMLNKKFMPQPVSANGQTTPGSGKFMQWGMPAISTLFAYSSFPAAVGVYWIYKTVIGILKQYILSKMYPVPVISEEELAEYRKQMKVKKKKVITIEVDEDDDSFDHLTIRDKNKSNNPDESGDNNGNDGSYQMLSGDDSDLSDKKVDWAPLKEDKPDNKKGNGNGKEG